MRDAAGSYRWFLSRAIPIRDAGGKLVRWFGTSTDVSELRAAETALRESEARFRQLADSMPQIVFAADGTGRLDYYNRRWHEFTGLAGAPQSEDAFLAVLHPEDRARYLEHWRRCVETGENYQAEYRLRAAATGEFRWQLARALPVPDPSGQIVRWFGTCTDIHDWKLVQNELRRRTESLEVLNRLGAALAAERDLTRIGACVAEAGREMTGAAFAAFFFRARDPQGRMRMLDTVVGMPRDAFATFSLPLATALLDPALRAEGAVRVEDALNDVHFRLGLPFTIMAEGHQPLRSYLAVPVLSREGDRVGVLCFGHPEPRQFGNEAVRSVAGIAAQAAIALDNANLYAALSHELRQKTEAEDELRVAQEQLRAHASALEQEVERRTASLREAIAQMEEFSYSVSHDLRAPLRAMNAYAQALLDDYGPSLDDTARSYLDRIRRSSQRMENLTHDVLTYSRVARAEVRLTEVNLELLLRDVIGHYDELQPPRAEVTVARPLSRVRAHEASLAQCLGNLLTNAAKFVIPGVQPRIRVWTESRNGRVRLWIEDNGIGIAPEHQEKLFQVFERAPTHGVYEGTGIGLAIVRKAVEKMGGRAGVESEGVAGSRFWIELLPA
jgi:PAS domain S-box-containing protein